MIIRMKMTIQILLIIMVVKLIIVIIITPSKDRLADPLCRGMLAGDADST